MISFAVTYDGGTTVAGVIITGTCGPTFSPTPVDVSSEQTSGEPAPSGFVAAAFDGDPSTYWHSQWSSAEPAYPHWVEMDAGDSLELCALNFLPRQGSANGRPAEVTVSVSDDGEDWTEVTECDTSTTGRGGCRSHIEARVVEATATGYRWVSTEVFNNLVLFKR
ncbi:discoidin domain-containing protein [Tessaracoccus rhinocerotis]|uniref:discoidin domain-containing protein n=1 Tax=Tessaracoccus rhinocerotis TaxID=1689449 RepID=UPI00163DB7A7|nr:discoidin domain-containing protein [Tessaracoccus rhinocerotis]